VGQTLAKRNSCAIALAIGLPIIAFSSYMIAGPTLFNAYLQDFAQFSRQTQLNSNLDITFAHAALSVNPGHEVGMGPVMHLISWMIAIGAFSQVALLAKRPEKQFELIVFSTLIGVFLVPIMLPHLPFYDLSIFILGGLIIYCTEWREPFPA
jgi:hypothetical protein